MNSGVSDILATRTADDSRLPRIVAWSIGIHAAGLVIGALLPASWLTNTPMQQDVMVISLGGAVGPRSTGTAPIAGRQVDVEATTRRPEPPRPPAAVKPDTMPPPAAKPVPVKPPPPKPDPVTAPPASTAKPPVAGARVQQGTAAADTGASGINQGLTLTGGAGGGDAVDLNNFNPEWVAKFKDAINRTWQRIQPEAGFVVLRFTIRRDGSVAEAVPQVIESSGSFLLQQASRRALADARLPALPADYTESTLVVRLRFDYDRR